MTAKMDDGDDVGEVGDVVARVVEHVVARVVELVDGDEDGDDGECMQSVADKSNLFHHLEIHS